MSRELYLDKGGCESVLEQLVSALASCKGATIVSSHDEAFLADWRWSGHGSRHVQCTARLKCVIEPTSTTRRFELTLHKPWLGRFPKPTVVVNGTAQPSQWGTRNWKIPGNDAATVTIFLFNRMWRFGEASFIVEPGSTTQLLYSAPWLPFGPGRIRAVQ